MLNVMNDKLRKSYRDHFGFTVHQYVDMPKVVTESSKKESDSLLSAIYAVDPRTGLPTGDIACYVSSNTSPEVKKFILDNIMMDTSSSALPSIPDGMSEDEVFALQRSQHESIDDYRERLADYTQKQIEYIQIRQNESKVATGDSE